MIFKKKQDAAVQQTAAGEAKPAAKGGKAAAFFRKNWKWMVPVVCVAVLGGWFILRPDKAQNANTDINYVQVSPSKRDVSNTLSGTGTLNPANTYNVKSLVAGKVLTSSFEEGDIVEEGTVLYTVDSSDATTKAEQASIALQQAQRSYDKTADRQYVRAEVAGVVSALKVAKGDEVTSGQEVAVIRDSSKMVLRLEFPAADAATFSVGQSAEVTLDGTFEMLTGTVTAVTGTDALSTGNLLTRTVTIAVRNAGGLTTAQAATATINGVNCIAAKCFEYQAERTLTALAAGTVTAINVPEGGAVNKDDIVLQISGEDLTEAIALGHDLGHTPFGHAGERLLNSIVPGGFAHFRQSLRVVERLEKEGAGLNLTWEVRNGIERHTGGEDAATLEGQVVALADKVAYINHDIDDAVRGGVLTDYDIPREFSEVLGSRHSKRINTMIWAIIRASLDRDEIRMEEPVYAAMMGLREFMFKRVYVASEPQREEQKAEGIIEGLYGMYSQKPKMIPRSSKVSSASKDVHVLTRDYIAGMSDRYAVAKFSELFIPSFWHR